MPRFNKPILTATLAAALTAMALPARALELGLITTYIHNDAIGGGGLAHGGSLMVQEEVWHYADVGARVGYMRSDCFKTFYIPVEVTGCLKYPFLEERLVPCLGIIGEYRVFTRSQQDLENAFGVSPYGGVTWWFSKEKHWGVYIEARYQFLQANQTSGAHSRFDGPGGSGGLTYRF